MDKTRIDYVIVLDRSIRSSRKLQYVDNFIKYLEKRGIKLSVKHENIKENVYITVQLSERGIQYFAYMYDIDINNTGHTYLPKSTTHLLETKYFQTPLGGDKDLFRREGQITNKERILVAQAILNEAKFGDSEIECGLEKLIRFRIAKAAYPLHDGDYLAVKNDNGDLNENDRQLLLKYWASFSLWHKEQPLNLIEKYFGTEVAFYFAWLGFYNKMLIPAALVGLVISIASILKWFVVDHERVNDICESKLVLCPLCHSGRNCVYRPLSWFCAYSKISIVFDNSGTVFFAVFMSFWATLVINLWQRFENTLKIRWNMEFQVLDTKYRVAYNEKCTHRRWSPISGVLEPYVPVSEMVTHQILSYAICLFLILVNFAFCFGVILYRVSLTTIIRLTGSEELEVHGPFILQATSACLQAAFIKLFEMFYNPLSVWLTDLENPRTQSEYDQSVIQKIYILSFVNNYASLFYLAFMKGRFYSPHNVPSPTRVETDLCHPTGCLMSLCLQLSVLMLLKSMIFKLLPLLVPNMRRKFAALYTPTNRQNEAQWEKEFRLNRTDRFTVANQFVKMIIQYGFVTFFVAAFPLAPLFALMNNCLELRLDAYKLIVRYRRPEPKQYSGIGAWNHILWIITHLSIATNAFVLAFTSDFVPREMYKAKHNNSLEGYIKSTLSLYDMHDYEKYTPGVKSAVNLINNSTLCYYPGARYPPGHPKKYQLSQRYWRTIAMKLLCVIVFEHIILITNGFLSYVIPDVPQTVKDTLHYNRTRELESKLKIQAEDAKKVRRRLRKPSLQIYRSSTLQ